MNANFLCGQALAAFSDDSVAEHGVSPATVKRADKLAEGITGQRSRMMEVGETNILAGIKMIPAYPSQPPTNSRQSMAQSVA
ncbi:MAG: hypothetical protein P1U87_23320 [Verrucomicrobiales bacterium]|nr:hypothetical protein [Verrucomicrobiales bacterium]